MFLFQHKESIHQVTALMNEKEELLQKIQARYDEQTTPYYAAARPWVDAIIDPRKTRQWISEGIKAANHAPVETFNPGVIQT